MQQTIRAGGRNERTVRRVAKEERMKVRECPKVEAAGDVRQSEVATHKDGITSSRDGPSDAYATSSALIS